MCYCKYNCLRYLLIAYVSLLLSMPYSIMYVIAVEQRRQNTRLYGRQRTGLLRCGSVEEDADDPECVHSQHVAGQFQFHCGCRLPFA